MKFTSILMISFTISIATQAQKNKFPTDLPKSKIIFLAYEMLPENDPSMNKTAQSYYHRRNLKAEEANKKLEVAAKGYPFEYTISTRADYKNLKEQGYKYVLNNEFMEKYNNGESVSAGRDIVYEAYMYIMDLQTGKIYNIFLINDSDAYYYTSIMQKFIKKVKKEFD